MTFGRPRRARSLFTPFAVAAALAASPAFAQDEIFLSDALTGSVRVFSRTASGDAAPIRILAHPTPNGVAVDERHAELFVSGGVSPDVQAFPRSAVGSAAPLRTISGAQAYKVGVDPIANELFVSGGGGVRVFARSADGTATPLRALTGVSGGEIRVDRVNDEIALITPVGVCFFPRSSDGAVPPLRTINVAVQGGMDLDVVHDEVVVGASSAPFLRVYSRSSGALLRSIDGASTTLNNTCGGAVAVDPANGEVLISCGQGPGTTSLVAFSRTASGDVAPLRTIVGLSTGLSYVTDIAVTKTEVTPQSLAVDTIDGGGGRSDVNGVLEPGESVILTPTWANATGSGVALSSTMLNLTGPIGTTYAIADATVDYGTIAAASTGTCAADCAAMTLLVPAVRPAAHWDMEIFENPSTDNLLAPWHIHVGDSFPDVPRSAGSYKFVETIFHNGVTAGCGASGYCPGSPTTRAQMAVFLLLADEGASYVPEPVSAAAFSDVPTSHPFARWIKELARRGVTAGCGNGNFCPGASVTRGQMAVFLLRTKEGPSYVPPDAVGTFTDVPASSPFAKWVEELSNRGITAGCSPGLFCPDDPVTRGQMAVFLTTTFSLSLTGL